MEEKEVNNDFNPREYQIELFEKAIKQNTIIFLPTGSGKTYIATMVIKHKSKEIERKYSEGGKRTFFLVNTVALVQQQAENLARHLPFSIGKYSGDLGVDYWELSRWMGELETHEVLVMTSQIFLDMLRHTYITFPRVNLIIMDECHHAVNKHSMRQIMELFEGVPEEHRPHILGLTATLLNGNIKADRISSEIHKLEVTLHSKISRAKNEEMIQAFSTNPEEEIVYYDIQEKDGSYGIINKHISEIFDYLSCIQFESEAMEIEPPMEGLLLLNEKKSDIKKLNNMLSEILICAEDLGSYAANYALLSRLITLERLRLSCYDTTLFKIYSMVITDIHKLRKELHMIMSAHEENVQPIIYATSKVKNLFKIFKDFPKDAVALVFVKRRITAKVLCYIFDDINKNIAQFHDIKPAFIVGHNSNVYNDTRECLLERKKNIEILRKFSLRETNLLFASDVVEEGIDVQNCNYVIKFDNPNTLCSYIQSKGRARHKDSKYIIFAANDPKKPFKLIYEQYRAAEKKLTDELSHGKDEYRSGGSEFEAEMYLYSDDIEPLQPFGPLGPKVTIGSAVSLLNRYSSQLPQDKFTKLTVTYWKKLVKDKVAVALQLPVNSPLREVVEGPPCDNVHAAKACAALEACKKLYDLGEFNSLLLPIGCKMEIQEQIICPLWSEKESSEEGRPGSKKRRRLFTKHIPRWICECTPKPNRPTFVHMIKITPNYSMPDTNRQIVFYNILRSPANFAVLTSKRWPKICQFSLYMNVGEVLVDVSENVKIITFSEQELQDIFNFHCLLFTDALTMKKKFLVKDLENGENSYYIAPVIDKNGEVIIDWNTIEKHKTIPEPKAVLPENRGNVVVSKSRYHGKIVIPWYRPNGYMLKYIVTKICEDENPCSPFPSDNFKSYDDYFSQRYSQKIVNKNQPLLEVRAISSKNNCLLPRGKGKHNKRRRRDEDDLEETLVPELCTLVEFPSVYMLKVTLIPSAMHRITLLLLAEELRQQIAEELQLGKASLPNDFKWKPLTVDPTALVNTEEPQTQQRSTIEVSNMLADKMESLNPSDCPWDKDEEPVDIERNIKSVDHLSIIHYDKFAKKKMFSGEDERSTFPAGNKTKSLSDKRVNYMKRNIVVPEIELLKHRPDSIGPEISEMLQVIIAATANDIINYERLETLGDSFLKYITSAALFTYFPTRDEGKLTYLKDQVIGNRNLFYCGRNIHLGSIIKVNDFVADDWDIPHYSLLPTIKKLMTESKLSPGLLYQINLSKLERESGLLRDETLEKLWELFCKSEENEENRRTSVGMLGEQCVSDKVIADSVEALIGVYLKACGIEGTMKLCKWLKIISEEYSDIATVLTEPAPSAVLSPLSDVNDMLIQPELLESALGYKFKDRSFLLQALTHSTFSHMVTDCYQRLEFLGDAILDFLITSHIYEKCGKLCPGDLTDLRSALVNNVTFACLTVRHGFHKFVLSKACQLSDVVNRFVVHQERRNHQIGAEVLFLVDEEDVKVGEAIDVPKMLGDIFESLAGAVYLDSNKSLDTVWQVFYRLMHKEIEEFSIDVPKNNVRLLYEKFPVPAPTFGKAKVQGERGVIVPLHINHNGELKTFHGIGENKNKAKLAAAKVALRHYHNSSLGC